MPSKPPASAALIAFETGCCDAFKEPGAEETSSVPISLQAGQSYYIEAFYKEGGGGDYVQVAWRKETDATPAASLAPIPGSFLSTLAPTPELGVLDTPLLASGQATLTWSGGGTLQESADLVTWTNVPGNPGTGYTVPVAPGTTKFYRLTE